MRVDISRSKRVNMGVFLKKSLGKCIWLVCWIDLTTFKVPSITHWVIQKQKGDVKIYEQAIQIRNPNDWYIRKICNFINNKENTNSNNNKIPFSAQSIDNS